MAPNQPENLQSDAKPEDPSPDQPASEPPKPENREEEEEEEEEEGECGFCVFMKGGGCRDAFVDWENCRKEAEENKEDFETKCSQISELLVKCMISHSDYYAPIVVAGKRVEEQALIELEEEKLDTGTNNNEQKAPSHSNQK